jgi:hypothetical protein
MKKAVPMQRHGKSDRRQLEKYFLRNLNAVFPEDTDVYKKANRREQHPVENKNFRICMNQFSQNCRKPP